MLYDILYDGRHRDLISLYKVTVEREPHIKNFVMHK